MKSLHYATGEIVMAGDLVKLGSHDGWIKLIGEKLDSWGLPKNAWQNKVMIESTTMGLVCESADSEDLVFVARSEK